MQKRSIQSPYMLTKRDLLRSAALASVAAAGVKSSQAWAQWSERPGFFKAKDIAEAGFIYGLPMVMAYGVMNQYAVDKSSGQYKAPFNTLFNEARVFTYEDTAVITPNSDTPYSFAWLDLRAEPIVFSVPAIDPKRYYALQLNDLNTYNFGYVGTRATGSDAGSYMVVGPRWTGVTPAGIKKVFRSTTDFCLALFRTQLFDPADIEAVKKVQAGYKAQPLSSFLNQPPPAPAPALSFPKFEKDLVRTEFFEYLDFALQFAPALPEDRWIREQLARIGVGPLPQPVAGGQSRDPARHEGRRAQGHRGRSNPRQGYQRLARRRVVRRCRILSWRLAPARGSSEGGHLWQRRGGGNVPSGQSGRRWQRARLLEVELHAYVPCRATAAGQCVLVGHDV
ncbi:hypothetical protein M2192_005181 [Bradyrhizobium elkanii USDA 61]|uniref:DUF1254 domain-containing protein n=1 Tax=Bradyrhizobium elkanii TaxID=29448 RepID=A0A8I1Y0R8_BRAEL|nr:hypothetical protein [Bradyrhizobium elkanii]MCS4008221.1 hypothetical protein [Bradyrhizobium elkanii USDA 61]MCP1928451.1 hypothetical protein [Bradyrhizobium elkanii]MCP1973058.1 hypothetical protein [Bradyrhizobium elkanii]MCS3580935.1 hypothetical protein [Bradyrhizobium elkanii]